MSVALRTVWEIPTEPVKRVNGKEDDHPADAPVACSVLRSITSRDDSTVLDPYAGWVQRSSQRVNSGETSMKSSWI